MLFDLEPTTVTYRWIGILLSSLIFTVAGTWIPRFFQQREEPRSHNSLRLTGEILARQQLAYMVYIMALRGATFRSDFTWAIDWLNVFLGLNLLSYIACTAFTSGYRNIIVKDHGPCREDCTRSLRAWTVVKMLVPPLIPSAIACYLAIQYAFLLAPS